MTEIQLIQVGKYFHPVRGGMETHLYHLCQRFKEEYDLKVIVANTDVRTVNEVLEGVSVTRLANLGHVFSSPICPSFVYRLNGLIRGHNNLVHLHLPNPVAHLSYTIAKHHGKLIVTWHSDIVRQKFMLKLYKNKLLMLLDSADLIIATSPQYIESSPFLNCFRQKCAVVPHGVDCNHFKVNDLVKKNIQYS